MDFGTILIGLVCIALCAMPFVLTTRGRKKREKALVMSLKNLAKNENSEITQYETCGNYAIGVDEVNKIVFFQLKSKEINKYEIVKLDTIKKCRISNISSVVSGGEKIIEKLNLHLTPITKSKEDTILEFYNADLSFQLSGELQSIQEWNSLINKILVAKK
ncbi:hypothetical protein MKD41_06535 [Lutibacter sp. A64]|uniref:hypothetical protein n=1 Tax=Lutibacter sp. A64 TaxID=2918526 RepID=UPI001F06673F|nr:hypothetical protein [Lutibacter sp. A64]UMB55128.1 hypothetical protein MKD41_06535 [Lutibacter sp. A64]